MEYKNIHFQPEVTPQAEQDSVQDQVHAQPVQATHAARFREVITSPNEEYQRRPGQVEPISNALASMILYKSGINTVTRKGLKVNRKELGGARTYWRADSPICNQLTGEQSEFEVVYVWNPNNTDLVHLLDKQGRYLESLPAKDKVDPLDAKAAGKQIAEHNRQIGRAASHLQNLQGDETRKDLERASRNAEAANRIISTLPAKQDPAAKRQTASAEPTPADQIDAIEQLAEQGRSSIKKAVARDRALEKAVERKFNNTPAPAPPARKNLIPDPLDI